MITSYYYQMMMSNKNKTPFNKLPFDIFWILISLGLLIIILSILKK